MFTSSFGCTSSPARLAITSFAFMFDEVPDPVRGRRDPLGLLLVEQAELRVHASGSGLDATEPAGDVARNRLARDVEVLDRLLRLGAPQLLHEASVSRKLRPATGAFLGILRRQFGAKQAPTGASPAARLEAGRRLAVP